MLQIWAITAAVTTLLAAGNGPAGARARDARAHRAPNGRDTMARIPSGSYRPLYAAAGARTRVAAFTLDREPVTRADFLGFVRENPAWRRSVMSPALADHGYLAGWRGDLDAGDATDLRRPVTAVSRHAASAYCASLGKRLPTLDEWEYAAAASETRADASGDPRFGKRLLELYAHRPSNGILSPIGSGFRNVYGVRDLHGGAWEWTGGVAVQGMPRGAAHAAMPDHMPSCASAALGATDQTNYPAFLRYAFRAALSNESTVLTLGFRCAAS